MKATKDEYVTIGKIAARASQLAREVGLQYPHSDVFMDIAHVHEICPLRLSELAEADDGNFGHDVFGIYRHFNRQTLKIENCFLPRFAK